MQVIMLVIIVLLMSTIFVAYGQHQEVNRWYESVTTWDEKNVVDHIIPVPKPDYAYMMELVQPQAGEILGHTFTVQGRAHVAWYSGGEFPLQVQTENGVVVESYLVRGELAAREGDFVPFSISVSAPYYTGRAKIVVKRANPYRFPEYDWSSEIPVIIQ